MANNDLASIISKMLGAKIEKVEKQMDTLDINDMIALVDAVALENSDLVYSIISGKMSEDEDDEDSTDDDFPEFDDPEVSDELEHDPLEETAYDVNIGDQVSVGGKNGIVKIARGPNDTVGVLVDGNMTMVQRGEVKPLKEHVMGMTMLPDLRRMQELAGISISDLIEPQAETDSKVEVIDVSPDNIDGCCDPKIAIDAAIDQIEELLPQLKVGDYREVTQRIQKAMNVIYENLQIVVKPVRLSESYVQVRSDALEELQRMLSDISKLMTNIQKAGELVADGQKKAFGGIGRMIDSINDVITKTTKKVKPSVGESSPNRRSFKDYLQELDNNQQTIGRNRSDAIKALKTRMGDTATIQDATKAFDQMKTTGKIKQQGNKMTMAPMGDEDLDKTIAGNSGVNAPK